jgi:hypothetical protein
VTRPTAPLPALAAALHALAARVAPLDLVEVLREVPAHEHEPGILRDPVRCPTCAATVRDRDREEPET